MLDEHIKSINIDLLDLNKGDRVVVAMSGGVDSSATAGILKYLGMEVIGITLELYDGEEVAKKGACCAGRDIYDAKEVARKLEIPHYVLNYSEIFKKNVIDDFADTYINGKTPIPCVRCNQKVKFKDLFETAKDLGAKALVTGHYVRRVPTKNGPELHRGIDFNRDQSYFLFTTTEEQLDFLRFPLGDIPKTITRAIAETLGLKVALKPDSQDICFVMNGHYSQVVEKLRPGSIEKGFIVNHKGEKLGEHNGIINYTIGQRKGLGIANEYPLYVVELNYKTHEVVVGPREMLAQDTIELSNVNWLNKNEDAFEALVKIRSSHNPAKARVIRGEGDTAKVKLEEAEYGVSPGQACVFYDVDTGFRMLGGGWIEKSFKVS